MDQQQQQGDVGASRQKNVAIVVPRGYRLRDEFICPITRSFFTDPVIAADGHTYDRAAIEQWFHRSRGASSGAAGSGAGANTQTTTSPKTGEVLDHLHLIPNHNLQRLLKDMVKEGDTSLYCLEEGGAVGGGVGTADGAAKAGGTPSNDPSSGGGPVQPLPRSRPAGSGETQHRQQEERQRPSLAIPSGATPAIANSSRRASDASNDSNNDHDNHGPRLALIRTQLLSCRCLGPPESDWNGRTFRFVEPPHHQPGDDDEDDEVEEGGSGASSLRGGRRRPNESRGAAADDVDNFVQFTDATVSRMHFEIKFVRDPQKFCEQLQKQKQRQKEQQQQQQKLEELEKAKEGAGEVNSNNNDAMGGAPSMIDFGGEYDPSSAVVEDGRGRSNDRSGQGGSEGTGAGSSNAVSSEGRFVLRDVGSAGGTFVRIPPGRGAALRPGMRIMLGKHQLVATSQSTAQAEAATAATAAAQAQDQDQTQAQDKDQDQAQSWSGVVDDDGGRSSLDGSSGQLIEPRIRSLGQDRDLGEYDGAAEPSQSMSRAASGSNARRDTIFNRWESTVTEADGVLTPRDDDGDGIDSDGIFADDADEQEAAPSSFVSSSQFVTPRSATASPGAGMSEEGDQQRRGISPYTYSPHNPRIALDGDVHDEHEDIVGGGARDVGRGVDGNQDGSGHDDDEDKSSSVGHLDAGAASVSAADLEGSDNDDADLSHRLYRQGGGPSSTDVLPSIPSLRRREQQRGRDSDAGTGSAQQVTGSTATAQDNTIVDPSHPLLLLRCFAPEGTPIQGREYVITREGATLGRKQGNTISFSHRVTTAASVQGGEIVGGIMAGRGGGGGGGVGGGGDEMDALPFSYVGIDSSISGEHATILRDVNSDTLRLYDGVVGSPRGRGRSSTNGTWIRLSPIHTPSDWFVLEDRMEILVGTVRFQVCVEEILVERDLYE